MRQIGSFHNNNKAEFILNSDLEKDCPMISGSNH